MMVMIVVDDDCQFLLLGSQISFILNPEVDDDDDVGDDIDDDGGNDNDDDDDGDGDGGNCTFFFLA